MSPDTITPANADLTRQEFGKLFVGVARRWRAALDASLEAINLSDATWAPLVHIERSGGGISQTELASRVGIDGSTLVRLLDILGKKELIERKQSPTDRRTNLLFVTPLGKKTVTQIIDVLTVIEEDLLTDLDARQLDAFTTALTQIDTRIKAVLHKHQESTP